METRTSTYYCWLIFYFLSGLCVWCAPTVLRLTEKVPLISTSCFVCHNRYGLLRQRVEICSECGKEHCAVCRRSVLLMSLGETQARDVCLSCIPSLKSRVRSNKKVASMKEKDKDIAALELQTVCVASNEITRLTKDEVVAANAGQLQCSNCTDCFSLASPPHRCIMCNKLNCLRDVIQLPLVGFSYKSASNCSSLVCRVCLPAARAMLSQLSSISPVSEAAMLEMEKSDAFLAAPVVSLSTALPITASACSACRETFSLASGPVACGKCKNMVCSTSCAAAMIVPSINPDVPTTICSSCFASNVTPSVPVPSSLGGVTIRGLDAQGPADLSLLGLGSSDLQDLERAKQLQEEQSGRASACTECQKAFSLIRRSKKCEHCFRDVCSSCCKDMKMEERGWSSARTICTTCSVSLTDICPICKLDFDVNRSYSYCQSCSRSICSVCSVARPHIPALGWQAGQDSGERICADCNPAIVTELNRVAHSASLDSGPSPAAEENFNSKEKLAVSIGELKCKHCSFPFSAVRVASKCATCKESVCSSCSRGNRLSASWLRVDANTTTCNKCWPQVKTQLETLVKKKPDLRSDVEQEIIMYEAAVGKGKGDEDIERPTPLALTPGEAHSMTCNECTQPFSAFRRIKGCFKCGKFFCNDSTCGGKFRSKSLGDGLLIDLCHTCAIESLRDNSLEIPGSDRLASTSNRETSNSPMSKAGAPSAFSLLRQKTFGSFGSKKQTSFSSIPADVGAGSAGGSGSINVPGGGGVIGSRGIGGAGGGPEPSSSGLFNFQLGKGGGDGGKDGEVPSAGVDKVGVPNRCCEECGNKFSLLRKQFSCAVCSKCVCSKCCSEECSIPAADVKTGRICNSCEPMVSSKIQLAAQSASNFAGPFPSDAAQFSLNAKSAILSKESPCHACLGPMGADTGCLLCHWCQNGVCGDCSSSFVNVGKGLGKEVDTVNACVDCWPQARAELQKLKSDRPQLSAVDEALAKGSLEIGPERVARSAKDLNGMSAKALEKQVCSGSCGCTFDAFRPASKCANCESLVCSQPECSGTYGANSTTLCCKCAPAVLGLDTRSTGVNAKAQLQQQLSLNPVIQQALTLKGAGCSVCLHEYGALRSSVVCEECGRQACSICTQNVELQSIASRRLCAECVPDLKQRLGIQLASKPEKRALISADINALELCRANCKSRAKTPLTKAEDFSVKSGNAFCRVCQCGFSATSPVFKCSECQGAACEFDSKELTIYSTIKGGIDPVVVCKDCWPAVAVSLSDAAKSNAALAPVVQAELKSGNLWAAR